MNIPLYIFEMAWFREMGVSGRLLLFDAIRAVHLQYGGMEIDLTRTYGITFTHATSRAGLSVEQFRKARKQLLFAGVLNRIDRTGFNQSYRDVFNFRLPR